MDKLNAISVFCKVIETQSFTQAATQQNISVSMASKLVAQLEERLKTRLIQRTTRKISPTEAGLLYYHRCQPILRELEEAESSISSLSSALHGSLSISVPRDFGLLFLTPNLSDFIRAYPHLHVDITFNDRMVDLVAEGYDLALRIGNLQDSSLVAKKIATASRHIVASPQYLAQHGRPTSPDELAQYDCLLYKGTGNQIYWEFEKDQQLQRIKMESKLVCNNGLTLVELAKAGLGILNIPDFFIKEALKSGELVEVLTDYRQQPLDIHIVYPHRRHLPAKTKAFMTFLQGLSFTQQMNV
ncbi:LysR family transcriptional regulator [Pasteurella sp. PK-2025]|uniref:LysR family transcriptional regulator n=1 Tax=Pasteurella sp. PK-2025 TaxID=3413133 RepID=UPI003C7091E1